MADTLFRIHSSHDAFGVGFHMTLSGESLHSSSAGDDSVEKHTPGDYVKPVDFGVARRWKRQHEQKTMRKITETIGSKKSSDKISKEQLRKLARKIPTELLAQEWLKDSQATLEVRAYMVDKVLPTLILGVEKLLTETDKRGLSEVEEMDPNFNPINYLAQYLMRNNPRYSNFAESSPYVRSLREVGEELRRQLFGIQDNRLARIKAEVKRKREDRERQEAIMLQEKIRREHLLQKQFEQWNVSPSGRVELSLLQNALKSFAEMVDQYPEELQEGARYSHPLDPTDETGTTLNETEFTEFLSLYVDSMPSLVFDQFMEHMVVCAAAHQLAVEREALRIILTNLFMSCDTSGIGILDRHRILNLFEQFYDKPEYGSQSKLRNPRKWPVVEVEEADDSLSDEEEETSITEQEESDDIDTQETKQEDGVAEKEEEGEKKVDEEIKVEDMPGVSDQEAEVKPETSEPKVEEVGKEGEEEGKEGADQGGADQGGADQGGADQGGEATDKEGEGSVKDAEGKAESASEKSEGEGKDVQDGGLPKEDSSSLLNVTFAAGTAFESEKASASIHSRSQSQLSAFDENSLNVSQFVGLMENFLGTRPDRAILKALLKFIKQSYMETEEEKLARLAKVRKEQLSAKRKVMMDQLFEKWDNDGSGYLDMDEVITTMSKYKDGQEVKVIKQAKSELKKQCKYLDQRLNKREFRKFILIIVDSMPGGDSFDFFMEFLTNSLERSHAERVRGEARKKWLQRIIQVAETSGACLEPVYKEVFQALFKDAEAHGGGKKISASIAMLERNVEFPERGPLQLRYVAATVEDAEFVLGQILYQDMPGISFSVVEEGKPIHVPRVANHGNIQFWNPDHRMVGSFIVVPLKDRKKRVFGLLGIDTLRDSHHKAIFITHEIQYFQGVARSLSVAYHHVDLRRKLMKITESAVSWVQKRSPHVFGITVYMVEPDDQSADYVLRKMMFTNPEGKLVPHQKPPRLERKDNLFRDYLFKSVDISESVTADAYGERHLTFPLRDDEGHAIAVVDISIGSLKKLPPHENKEAQRMMRLLQTALKEITHEFAGAETNRVLDAEMNDDNRIEVMFDRIMLVELRDNVTKLDSKAYAELSSYHKPPKIVHDILKATLAVFNLQKAKKHEYDDWNKVKGAINADLANQIAMFDPTAEENLFNPAEVEVYLQNVPHYEVLKHGSLPAQYMFNWVFVTLSLVESTLKHKGRAGIVDVSKSDTIEPSTDQEEFSGQEQTESSEEKLQTEEKKQEEEVTTEPEF